MIGDIKIWTSDTIPSGWLLCNGNAVSRSTYSELFSLIGTTFGSGDGSTTFNLPDLKGYVPVGKDSGDTNINAIGKKYGEKTHTLTINEMPNHTHRQKYDFKLMQGSNEWGLSNNSSPTGLIDNALEYTGGGEAHNIMQPSLAINYIIKALNIISESKKISELNEATSVNDSDVLPIVQSGETKKVSIETILETIYPVGSIIIKDNSTDYSNWLGFTWQKVFAGKVLVGQDTSDTDFDTIGETGGEKTHTLTENEMPAHRHGIAQMNDSGEGGYGAMTTLGIPQVGWNDKYNAFLAATQERGNGQAHNIMQPYQVVAYWKRIS